jgi:hypothetical protein
MTDIACTLSISLRRKLKIIRFLRKEGWMADLEGWVADFVARLLATAALWVRIQTSLNHYERAT